MRVIMRSTAPRYPRGRLARARSEAERSGRSLGSRALAREEARGSVKRTRSGERDKRQKEKQASGRGEGEG